MEENLNSIDSIVQSFSKLLRQLDSDKDEQPEVSTSGTAESSSSSSTIEGGLSGSKLRKLYAEISEIQEGIEKYQLFKEGQDLYTKWLHLVEQSEVGEESGGHRNSSDLETSDLNAIRESSDQLSDLIALSYNNRGYLKYLQVDFKGALEDYTLALKHDSKLACAYYNRGLVTYRLAFFEQAVQNMKTAVSLDPSRQEFHEGLRKVSEMIGSPIEHKFRLEYGDVGEESSGNP